MAYSQIEAATTLTVADHKTLLRVWRTYDRSAQLLIGTIVVEKPLTKAQHRRLPSELRRKIQAPDDGLTFLERLWSLDDSRSAGQ